MTATDGEAAAVIVEQHGPVAVLRLNRPEAGNALTREMRPAVAAAWARVRDDAGIRAAVVIGAGAKHFCTGIDVRQVAETGGPTSGRGRAEDEILWSPLNHGVWKPVICALNGVVAGGGLHFVADADIVLAAPHAAIMDTHTSVGMVGAVEIAGLAHRLPLGSVLRLALMGRGYRMSAERAHQLGLVDELVPADQLLATAIGMGEAMAANSPAAMALSKQAVWDSLGRSRIDAAEYAWALARTHLDHPDVREGALAFAERRPPRWT